MSKANLPKSATLPFVLSLLEDSESALRALGLKPQDLLDIYNDYLGRQAELADIAAFIAQKLQQAPGVHSVTHRIKEPQHLLKKIVRKRKEYPEREITPLNYLDLVNDLVGVRVLHLYKEAWHGIGEFIREKWELKRSPYAYVKEPDKSVYTQAFTAFGCKVLAHPSGYKAVHIVIKTKPEKQRYFAEIQLRTLFEEGWSEIDHNIRYPDHAGNELQDFMLQLLNKLTTEADEMATHLRTLTDKLNTYQQLGKGHNTTELSAYVDKLPIRDTEKKRLRSCIERLTGKK